MTIYPLLLVCLPMWRLICIVNTKIWVRWVLGVGCNELTLLRSSALSLSTLAFPLELAWVESAREPRCDEDDGSIASYSETRWKA